MSPRYSSLRRVAVPLGALLALLGLYCCRDEGSRRSMLKIHTTEDFARDGRALLWPPWRALLTYVSIDDDVHLYYEYSHVLLGEEADTFYIAGRRQDPTKEDAAHLQESFARTGGLRLLFADTGLGYPPLALMLMLVPRAVARTLGEYRVAFAVLISLLYLAAWRLGWQLSRSSGSGLSASQLLWRAFALTACLGPLLVGRFDLLPALLTTASLWALTWERPVLASLLLLLGGSTKLYPVLLLPTWAALLWGFGGRARSWLLPRLLAPFAALLIMGVTVVVGRAGSLHHSMESVMVFLARPIQIESLVGSCLRALGAGAVYNFGSVNVWLPGWPAVAVDTAMALALLVTAAWAGLWASRRRAFSAVEQRQALCQFSVLTLLIILLTSKVFSPQYMIWCLPLVALLHGSAGRQLYVGLCAALLMTQVYFPFLYTPLIDGVPVLVMLVLVRNLVLLALAVSFAVQLARAPRVGEMP